MKGDYLQYKTIISHETWRSFSSKYPDCKELGLDYWTIRRLLSDLSDMIIEEVINNSLGFELPYRCGTLKMVGHPMEKRTEFYKRKKMDYARTDGHVYTMRWITKGAKMKLKRLYKFKTAKLIQKELTKAIREDKFFNWVTIPDKKLLNKLDP